MPIRPNQLTRISENHVLLAYVADLELEVDHLRKKSQFVDQEACEALRRMQPYLADASDPSKTRQSTAEIEQVIKQLAEVLRDMREPPGYHPAHDQVVAIAVRPLIDQVFRWQQRLWSAPQVVLRLELQCEHIEWFPARLRHILDNLISNALKYRDPDKGETRVTLGLCVLPNGYELRVSDNGVGMPPHESAELVELFYRSAPARAAGLGVGLGVVKLLVEQSGGRLTTKSGDGQGTTFVAVLPRYDVNDFLT